MSLRYIDSLTAQQLLGARITADMHTHITCCAHANQVLGGLLVMVSGLCWYYQWRLIGSSGAKYMI